MRNYTKLCGVNADYANQSYVNCPSNRSRLVCPLLISASNLNLSFRTLLHSSLLLLHFSPIGGGLPFRAGDSPVRLTTSTPANYHLPTDLSLFHSSLLLLAFLPVLLGLSVLSVLPVPPQADNSRRQRHNKRQSNPCKRPATCSAAPRPALGARGQNPRVLVAGVADKSCSFSAQLPCSHFARLSFSTKCLAAAALLPSTVTAVPSVPVVPSVPPKARTGGNEATLCLHTHNRNRQGAH